MRFDRFGIDLGQLGQHVSAHYALDITSVVFLPKGEEVNSANYVAEARAGDRFLIKLRAVEDPSQLETVYEAVRELRVRGRLEQLVAPRRSRDGHFASRLAGYMVAVFPFIEGSSVWDAGRSLSADGWTKAADLMAGLHTSSRLLDRPLFEALPQETFANPFRGSILRALDAAASLGANATMYQHRLRKLLAAERADILAALEKMEQFRSELGALRTDRVVTHGDPNLANLIVDGLGNVHLIDWGDLAVGPPERDLFMFTDTPADVFLRQYLSAYGRLRFHERLFAFYHYRWAVQEIADYTTRILFRNDSQAEDEHAWAELQPYVPVPHRQIETAVVAVQAAVRRVSGEWW